MVAIEGEYSLEVSQPKVGEVGDCATSVRLISVWQTPLLHPGIGSKHPISDLALLVRNWGLIVT